MNQKNIKTLVKRSASIGANATILCGLNIGKYSLIGAGAVVIRDVPDHALVVGNPGKIIGWVNEMGTRLEFGNDGQSLCGRFTLDSSKHFVCEKLRVATILGARPQFIKAALVSEKIKIQNNISEIIIHTGQHFDRNMSKIFFDEMNLSIPKYNLGVNRINFPKIINVMIKKIKPILLQEKLMEC